LIVAVTFFGPACMSAAQPRLAVYDWHFSPLLRRSLITSCVNGKTLIAETTNAACVQSQHYCIASQQFRLC